MNHELKAALFDFDGVVADTEEQYTKFWETIAAKYFPDIPDIAAQIKGQTLKDVFEKYLLSEADRAVVKRNLEEIERRMCYKNVAGVAEFIASLRQKGITTAVVTSSDRIKMNYVYATRPDIRNMFDRVFTAEDYKASKPSPDCYVAAAACFGLGAEQCIVFEDSINGLKAACSSGAFVVGVSTTNPASVVKQYADFVIPDFRNFTPDKLMRVRAERLGITD